MDLVIGLLLAHACFGFSFSFYVCVCVWACRCSDADADADADALAPAPAPDFCECNHSSLASMCVRLVFRRPAQARAGACSQQVSACLPACLSAYGVSESQTTRLVGCSRLGAHAVPKKIQHTQGQALVIWVVGSESRSISADGPDEALLQVCRHPRACRGTHLAAASSTDAANSPIHILIRSPI